METCKFHGVWVEFDRTGDFDREEFEAKRVCHDCKEVVGMEPRSEPTIFGHAKMLLRQGKLSQWESSLVSEFARKDEKELTQGQRKILARIVSESR